MNSRDLTQQNRSLATRRLKILTSGLLLASLAVPGSAWAQGLPSADSLGDAPPVDEKLAPAPTPRVIAKPAQPENRDTADGFVDETLDEETSDANEANDDAAPRTTRKVADDEELRAGPGVNLEGSLGFHHIASAKPGKANTYHIGLLGTFSKGSDVIRYRDENEFLDARLLLQATIIEHFSLNLGIRATNNVNTYARPQSMLTQGDLHLGLRGHLSPTPGMYLAADLTGFMPTGFSSSGLQLNAMNVRPRLLVTADFGELFADNGGEDLAGLTAHFNFGYLFDNSQNLLPDGVRPNRVERFAHQLSAYDYLEFGLGVEYALPYVAPFVAWNFRVPVNADDNTCGANTALRCVDEVGFAAFPDLLSLGLRAEPVENLGLMAGVDIGLGGEQAEGVPVTLPWQLVLGASWRIDPEPRVEYIETVIEKEKVVQAESESAFILGTVKDEKTGQPIAGAIITYRDPAEKTAQATNARGTFISYGFAPGKQVAIQVSHPDYAPADARLMIDGPGELPLEVKLKSVVKKGTVSGTVIDQDGNPVANARVNLDGTDREQITTGANGRFTREVGVGDYTVAASAPGYLAGGRDVQVQADKAVQLEITLRPEPKEELVEVEADRIRIKQTVFFDTGKATIQARSFDMLNQVASVMLTYPSLKKVRVEGHTDDVGNQDANLRLSRERAQSVVDYLVEQGVSRERLQSDGFGSSQPLVPNSSPQNRSLNRRVEFKIVEQAETLNLAK